MEYCRIVLDDSLEHHGILGQKWGKKNGPPYPLDASDHSAAEKKAGWKKSLDKKKEQNPQNNSRKGLSDKQKKILKTTVIVAGTTIAVGLAAYGGYKINQLGGLKTVVNGKLITNKILKGPGQSTKIPFKKYDTIPNISEAFKGINPNKTGGELASVNFKLLANDGKPLSDVNCQSCTFVQEMIQRGYKGIAQLIDTRQFSDEYTLGKLYKNPVIKSTSVDWNDVGTAIKGKIGERGNITIHMIDGSHSLRYEILEGKTVITDPQIGVAFDANNTKVWSSFYKVVGDTIKVCRTDNLELNDIEFISKMFAELSH